MSLTPASAPNEDSRGSFSVGSASPVSNKAKKTSTPPTEGDAAAAAAISRAGTLSPPARSVGDHEIAPRASTPEDAVQPAPNGSFGLRRRGASVREASSVHVEMRPVTASDVEYAPPDKLIFGDKTLTITQFKYPDGRGGFIEVTNLEENYADAAKQTKHNEVMNLLKGGFAETLNNLTEAEKKDFNQAAADETQIHINVGEHNTVLSTITPDARGVSRSRELITCATPASLQPTLHDLLPLSATTTVLPPPARAQASTTIPSSSRALRDTSSSQFSRVRSSDSVYSSSSGHGEDIDEQQLLLGIENFNMLSLNSKKEGPERQTALFLNTTNIFSITEKDPDTAKKLTKGLDELAQFLPKGQDAVKKAITAAKDRVDDCRDEYYQAKNVKKEPPETLEELRKALKEAEETLEKLQKKSLKPREICDALGKTKLALVTHTGGNHWAVIHIDFEKNTINYVDSLGSEHIGKRDGRNILKKLVLIQEWLSQKDSQEWTICGVDQSHKVTSAIDDPIQHGDVRCGLFVVQETELWGRGKSYEDIGGEGISVDDLETLRKRWNVLSEERGLRVEQEVKTMRATTVPKAKGKEKNVRFDDVLSSSVAAAPKVKPSSSDRELRDDDLSPEGSPIAGSYRRNYTKDQARKEIEKLEKIANKVGSKISLHNALEQPGMDTYYDRIRSIYFALNSEEITHYHNTQPNRINDDMTLEGVIKLLKADYAKFHHESF